MRLPLVVAALVIGLALPARAQSSLGTLTPRRGLLSQSQGHNGPVAHAKADFFLIGLGLTAAGLVLGGAGFAVLYLCRDTSAQGTTNSCHNQTTTTVGWVLAAPGLVPLVVGLFMLYAGTGSSRSSGGSSFHGAAPLKGLLGIGLAPLPGGGAMASGTFRF